MFFNLRNVHHFRQLLCSDFVYMLHIYVTATFHVGVILVRLLDVSVSEIVAILVISNYDVVKWCVCPPAHEWDIVLEEVN